jgi:hypothetical protein
MQSIKLAYLLTMSTKRRCMMKLLIDYIAYKEVKMSKVTKRFISFWLIALGLILIATFIFTTPGSQAAQTACLISIIILFSPLFIQAFIAIVYFLLSFWKWVNTDD